MVFRLPIGRKQYVLIGTGPGVQGTSASLKCVGAGGVHHWKGINFTVEDTTRFMQNLHKASRHPAVQGVEARNHGRSSEAPPEVTKVHGRAWSQTPNGVKMTGCNMFSAVSSTKARP